MDKLDLRIEPVELSPILTCEIGEKVNQHARATVSGFVKGEDHALLSQLYHKEALPGRCEWKSAPVF